MAGLVAIAGRDCTIHSPFWIPREWDLALNRRHAPLFLNDGYPLTLDEEIQITVPPGTEHSELPAAARGTEGPLAWQIDWARRPDGRLVATLRAELRHGDLSISETAQFQTQVRALLAALASDSRLTLSGRLSVR